MSDVPKDLDAPVQLPGGRTKRLGDLSYDDLMLLSETAARRAIRGQEAAIALVGGRAPKCDFEYADNTLCEADAEVIENETDWRCAAHRSDLSGR